MPTKAKQKSTTRYRKATEYVVNLPEYEKDLSHLMTQGNRAVDEEKRLNRLTKPKRRKKHAA